MSNALAVLDFPRLIIVVLATIVPSLLLLSLILYSDRRSREPLLMILICVFSGAFTICMSLLLDKIILKLHLVSNDLFTNINSYSVYKILMLAGVEEYCKLLVLYLFLYRNKAFDDIYDGFVYSSIIALSFSLIETFMYVFNEGTYADMTSLAVLRNFTAIPLHITCGIIMGYFVSLEKFSKNHKKKFINMALALLIPTVVHTIYNTFFSAITLASSSIYSIIVIVLFVLSIYFIGMHFIMKTNKLNQIFITNGYYPKKYDYLMIKSDRLGGTYGT